MTEMSGPATMSELERLEFTRRTDAAHAVIPLAWRWFNERAELDDALKSKLKKAGSFWNLVAIAAALGLHYFLSGAEYKFDVGSSIALFVVLYWCAGQWDISQIKTGIVRLNERLWALELTWNAACGVGFGGSEFWSIRHFKDIAFELGAGSNDDFVSWLAEQRQTILMTVCGVEKGLAVGQVMDKRDNDACEFARKRKESRKP
ncbi:MAG: hypothetical protein JJD98_01215 [Polaromonas sp.]|nr:hypothetical protein [Polaromonas sp.]